MTKYQLKIAFKDATKPITNDVPYSRTFDTLADLNKFVNDCKINGYYTDTNGYRHLLPLNDVEFYYSHIQWIPV